MRDKLHAKIMELVPPPPAAAAVKNDSTDNAVVRPTAMTEETEAVKMEPYLVFETLSQRDLREKIARESQKKLAEQFSIIRGGTIKKLGPVEIGAWPDPSGLSLLKIAW